MPKLLVLSFTSGSFETDLKSVNNRFGLAFSYIFALCVVVAVNVEGVLQ